MSDLHTMYSRIEQHMKKVVEKGEKVLVFVVYVGDGGLDLRCLNTYAVLK